MNYFRRTIVAVSLCTLAGTAYLVKKGDTLWDLSGQFQSNPFAWPDLWEANRHVQDPHWIYPGDSLCIPGADGACTAPTGTPVQMAAPVTSYPCPSGEVVDDSLPPGVRPSCHPGDRDADFKKQLAGLELRQAKEENHGDSTVFYYHQKSAPKLFNMYYQRLAPVLQNLEEHQKDQSWFTVKSGEKKEPLLHTLEHEVLLGYGKSTHKKLKVGDLAEIWTGNKVAVKSLTDNSTEDFALLRLTALARITAIGDTLSRAILVQSFRQLDLQKAKARPFTKPAYLEVRGYQPVPEVKLSDMGSIRLYMDGGLAVGQYSYVMVDRGASEGFRTGSGVAFWEEDKSDAALPPRLLGKGIVARAGTHESAVLVREIYSHIRRLEEGHKVSLTHLPVLK